MKKTNFKTIGFLPTETHTITLKNGKQKTITKILSTQVHKTFKQAKEASRQIIEARAIGQCIAVFKHLVNIDTLVNDVKVAKDNVNKLRFKSFNFIKGLFHKPIAYFRLLCSKIKLWNYIKSLNSWTKQAINETMDYSVVFNYNLKTIKF
jgi:hypothetical protein